MGTADSLKHHYEKNKFRTPALHVVLGSGLSPAFEDTQITQGWKEKPKLSFQELPQLAGATAPGHKGLFRYFEHEKTQQVLCVQVGRLHGYEGIEPRKATRPVVAAFEAGTKQFLLTNAAGALQKKFKVGSLMFIRDHVNMSGANPLYGPNPLREDGSMLGPRFVDMSNAYDSALNKMLKSVCTKNKLRCSEGIYLGLAGPTFETAAEVALYAKWGMGAVGMSTVWETIALRHAGAKVAGVSVISNMGTGLVKGKIDHSKVEAEVAKVAPKVVRSIFEFAAKIF